MTTTCDRCGHAAVRDEETIHLQIAIPDDAAATIEGAVAQFLSKKGAFTVRVESIALRSTVGLCAKSYRVALRCPVTYCLHCSALCLLRCTVFCVPSRRRFGERRLAGVRWVQ